MVFIGNGLVDVLFGDVNPSAKLVYTIAKNRTDYPADILYSSRSRRPQVHYLFLYIKFIYFFQQQQQ